MKAKPFIGCIQFLFQQSLENKKNGTTSLNGVKEMEMFGLGKKMFVRLERDDGLVIQNSCCFIGTLVQFLALCYGAPKCNSISKVLLFVYIAVVTPW